LVEFGAAPVAVVRLLTRVGQDVPLQMGLGLERFAWMSKDKKDMG
jgi:hypothetical protein